MAKTTGFMEFRQELPAITEPDQRINHSREFIELYTPEKLTNQAARCMDCGVPFCQSNCPLGNIIPEFNDAVYKKNFKRAYEILTRTNPFPEFTGRACPAPCESGCVLGINNHPVVIEMIEKEIIEYAFRNGLVKPQLPKKQSGKKVAVIGSGPTGLAAATILNQYGHVVAVYEKNDKPGGLLRYGIPDFKLDKAIVDRRISILKEEGIVFKCGIEIGVDFNVDNLFYDYDAVILACGCEVPREYNIPGVNSKNVSLAMPFLIEHSKKVAIGNDQYLDCVSTEPLIASGKNVVVIGGGDTASDCIGTSNRQKAASVTQLIRADRPQLLRNEDMPWPTVPHLDKLTSSQEEDVNRIFNAAVKEFILNERAQLTGVKFVKLNTVIKNKKTYYEEIFGSEQIIPCELALIAVGFSNPIFEGALENLEVELTAVGNVLANDNDYKTSVQKIFAAGDVRRGQSLIVWALKEGRDCAHAVHNFLTKTLE